MSPAFERCLDESLNASRLQAHADHLAMGDLFALEPGLVADAVQHSAARMRVEANRSWAEFCASVLVSKIHRAASAHA